MRNLRHFVKERYGIRVPAYHSMIGYLYRSRGLERMNEALKNIYECGHLLSSRGMNTKYNSITNIEPVDVKAGDDKFVFLSTPVPVPWGSDYGFKFVFDATELVEKYNVILGVTDLIDLYRNINQCCEDKNAFSDAQKLFRLSEKDKIYKILGKFDKKPPRIKDLPFVCDKRRKEWKGLEKVREIETLLKARAAPELLFTSKLSLKGNLKAVIFDGVFYEAENFHNVLLETI